MCILSGGAVPQQLLHGQWTKQGELQNSLELLRPHGGQWFDQRHHLYRGLRSEEPFKLGKRDAFRKISQRV